MTPVQLFGVVVRALGLVMIVYGVGMGFFGLIALVSPNPGVFIIILPATIVLLAAGLWLLRGAKSLIEFAYPETRGGTDRPPAMP